MAQAVRSVAARPRIFPRGIPLPEAAWLSRHRAMLVAAWVLCGITFAYAVATREPFHAVADMAPALAALVPATVLRAASQGVRREVASCAVMLALVIDVAVVVHLSGGLIEAHFLFFIVVSAATAYQTWAPFLTATLFVVVHHGVLGMLHPRATFNHPSAQEHPWLWALVHGTLIAVAAAVGVAAWRADELLRTRLCELSARSRLILRTVDDGIVAVDARGVVVHANPAAHRLLTAGAPLVHRRLHDVVHSGSSCPSPQSAVPAQRCDGESLGVPGSTAGACCPFARLDVAMSGRADLRRDGRRAVPVRFSIAPVGGDDEVAAVVTLHDLSSSARAEEAELALVELAEREEAQRLDVAALVAAFRPTPIDVEGLEIGVAYRPAANAPSCGDHYDWLQLPTGEVLVTVVDAMGRGTGATKDALTVTSTVRTLAVAGCPLEDLVARAGEVVEATHDELLATLVIAVLDPRTGRVRIAGGGHPPALVVTSCGAQQVLAEGLGIGYPLTGSTAIKEVQLLPGETLVLYTDGLIEGSHDIDAGLHELGAVAARLADMDPEGLAARLLTDVSTCAGDRDDCLTVVLRRPAETRSEACEVLAVEVDPVLSEVGVARRSVRRWLLDRHVPDDAVDTSMLLLSELTTNAIRHAGTSARVSVAIDGDAVRVAVYDRAAAALPDLAAMSLETTSGRGMRLVSAMSSRWGVDRHAAGKTVWALVPASASAERASDDLQAGLYAATDENWPDLAGLVAEV